MSQPSNSSFNWAMVSAIGALASLWFAGQNFQLNSKTSEDRTVSELDAALNELSRIEERAFSEKTSGCVAGGDCLGSLAFKDAYFGQYELLALQVADLASQVPKRVKPVENLRIAKALYTTGRLDKAEEYARKSTDDSDATIRFSSRVLIAQIAYMRDGEGKGVKKADEAINDLTQHKQDFANAEFQLKHIQVDLMSAEMLLVLGKREDSLRFLTKAYESLGETPATARKEQVDTRLHNLLKAYVQLEQSKGQKSFINLKKEVEQEIIDDADMEAMRVWARVPHAPVQDPEPEPTPVRTEPTPVHPNPTPAKGGQNKSSSDRSLLVDPSQPS
jgi:tetratricopeptide (TPR) repeat protein